MWLQMYTECILPSVHLFQQTLSPEPMKNIQSPTGNTAIFRNDNGEWLAPVIVAQRTHQAPPLLLCYFDEENTGYYEEGEDGEPVYHHIAPWYAPYIARLQQVAAFDIPNPAAFAIGPISYRLYAVTNLDAYHNIWARNSTDYSITLATFASDCDIAKLQNTITRNEDYYSTPPEDILSFSSWTHWNKYGGGSDEHIGYYYAKDAHLTDALWQLLDTDLYNTLFAHLRSTTFCETPGISALPIMLAETLQQASPLLLCQLDERLTYEMWDDKNWDYLPNTCWYAKDLEKLPIIAKFSSGPLQYHIVKVTDSSVGLKLWNHKKSTPITKALFADDLDLPALKLHLQNPDLLHLGESLTGFASWAYTHAFPELFYAHFCANTTETFQIFHSLYSEQKPRGKKYTVQLRRC